MRKLRQARTIAVCIQALAFRLPRSTLQFTSGRSCSHGTPVSASMSGHISAGTRSRFQRDTDAFDTCRPCWVRSCAKRDEPLAASHARSSADFSVASMLVAEYDTSQLRLPQLPTCNDEPGFYAQRVQKVLSERPTKAKKEPKPKDPFAVEVGRRLSAARHAKVPKLTGEALGEQIGATKTNVSQWESGSHMPDLKTLAALCDALDCSADQLLGRAPMKVSAAALEEAKAFDRLPKEQQLKWRAMRLTLFSPVL